MIRLGLIEKVRWSKVLKGQSTWISEARAFLAEGWHLQRAEADRCLVLREHLDENL